MMKKSSRRGFLLSAGALVGLPGGGLLAPGGKPWATADLPTGGGGTNPGFVSPTGYVLPSSVPLTLTPAAGETSPVHTSWPGFAWGHLPAGSKLVATVGGQSVPVQQDMESRWPDGSVCLARVAIALPVPYVAGQALQLQVTPTAGAPDRTPWITPAAMVAAHDVELRHYDGVSSTVATHTRLADIVANAPRDSWGTNPSAGWDVPISGPVEVMIRGWAYRRAPGAWGGGFHRWIVDVFWLSARVDGSYDVLQRSYMPNWDKPHPSGTLGDATACKRWVGATELWDNGARVYAWGGANDPLATTAQGGTLFPSSGIAGLSDGFQDYTTVAFTSGGGTLPSGIFSAVPQMILGKRLFNCMHHLNGELAVQPVSAFGSGGVLTLNFDLDSQFAYSVVTFAPRDTDSVLPSGITEGTKYRLGPVAGQTRQFRLYTPQGSQADDVAGTPLASFGSGGAGDVLLRSQPLVWNASQATGTIVVTPQLALHYGTALLLADTDAMPIKLTSKPRALVGVAWDEEYMARGARLWPRFQQGSQMVRYSAAETAVPNPAYRPGVRPWGPWLNTTGDNPGDNRIGYINHNAACALLMPADQDWQRIARRDAAGWCNWMMWWQDVSSGRMIVLDNGPDDVGGRYPQMGPSRPGAVMNGPSDPYLGPNGGGTLFDFSGYYDGYSNAQMDGSHMPCPWPVPAHMTGHPAFAEMGGMQANACQMYEGGASHVTLKGQKLWAVIGLNQQPRGSGWAIRAWDYFELFTPGAAPEGAYVAHRLDTLARFGELVDLAGAQSYGSPAFAWGLFWPGYNAGVGGVQQIQWDIGGIGLTQCASRRRRSGMLTMAAKKAVFDVGLVDRTHQGTTYGAPNGYHMELLNSDNSIRYSTMAQFIAGNSDYAGGGAPWPETGFYDKNRSDHVYQGFVTYAIWQSTDYAAVKRATLAGYVQAGVQSTAGDDPIAALADLNRRLAASPNTGIRFSGPNYTNGNKNGFFPSFAIVAG